MNKNDIINEVVSSLVFSLNEVLSCRRSESGRVSGIICCIKKRAAFTAALNTFDIFQLRNLLNRFYKSS